MNFGYTILYVENVAETLAFYEKAFGFKTKFLHESQDYGELDTGSTTLSFSSIELMKQIGKNPHHNNAKNPSFEIAFTTKDVPQALDKAIKAGASLIQPAEDMPWGQTTAYVADNNNFLVELCTPMG